jgi:hypothetical protein
LTGFKVAFGQLTAFGKLAGAFQIALGQIDLFGGACQLIAFQCRAGFGLRRARPRFGKVRLRFDDRAFIGKAVNLHQRRASIDPATGFKIGMNSRDFTSNEGTQVNQATGNHFAKHLDGRAMGRDLRGLSQNRYLALDRWSLRHFGTGADQPLHGGDGASDDGHSQKRGDQSLAGHPPG